MKKVKEYLRTVMEAYNSHEDGVYAAQATYYIIIASIPFLMLLLMILQAVPWVSNENIMEIMSRIIPENLRTFVNSGLLSVGNKLPKTWISIAAIATLWTASGGLMSVERGLSKINECTVQKNGLARRLKSIGFTLLFVFVIVDMMLVMVLGRKLAALICRALPLLNIATIGAWLDGISILTVILLFVCFLSIYTGLPMQRQKPMRQLPGALFATLCWCAFSKLFALYFSFMGTMSQIYGSLTAIVLFMIWIKADITILFLGAEINKVINKKQEIS